MRRAFLSRVVTIVASAAAVAAVVLSGTATTEAAGSQSPAPATPVAKASIWSGKKYVALGSSYASGPDVAQIVNVPCMRTGNDYPHQVAQARGMRLTDVSCSGATTANILRKSQRGVAEPQIVAVTPDTDLVTITVGGNDIEYIGRLTTLSCANAIPPGLRVPGCRHRHARPAPTSADYARVERSLVDVVTAVRQRAPHAEILIVDYLPVLDGAGDVCTQIPLTHPEAREMARAFDGLTAATARAAQDTGVRLVKASAAGAAHTACSAHPWVNGFEIPVPYHPTSAGKAGVARLILEELGSR